MSSLDQVDHAAACARVLELLRAGECYQVNVTRRLTAAGTPDPIALYDALTRVNPSPHASLCTLPAGADHPDDVAIVSASPELFLRIEPAADGRGTSSPDRSKARPPTRPRSPRSAKDRAENVMIVDLARNDLGRVCEFGSVQVPALCAIEPHPGLYHLVSIVTGRLRAEVDLADVVRATFPPASVTGAPKPRVMQAIEDLEPVRRGVYCGAVGWIDADRGRTELAVAIRTFTLAGGNTYLGVGGGIVADSQPDDEWAETELKAARLLARGRLRRRAPVPLRHVVIIWINGELMPLEEARVSPLDHGLVVGDGVFETLRVYRGVPFAWTRHLARLHASATGLGLDAPDSDGAARRRRRGARRERSRRGAPADHGHRRARAARISTARRSRPPCSWSRSSSSPTRPRPTS